ncbi:DUF6607 family protein [Mesonia maritima]|uniref:Uncharacterized protein n=1 Tax=Mesonia maritima TaxID=1793873 RepID=A0ABU1K459_9FLAO|nr:DUF6607 family protein [Mesonia maritima]MDR6300409.1 hypothetical protein [Mesonia maritima]
MKLKHLFTGVFAVAFGLLGNAQKSSVKEDKKAIKEMCGCFEVTFKYTETFAPEIDYEKAYDYTATALEWAEMIEEEDDKLSIQHLLVINDTTIIKHWRQDWTYEDRTRYEYDKNNHWKFVKAPKREVKGQWTQSVYQVDDSPRYAGSATWIHADGRHYWDNETDSPLPRREYSKRSDYNVMNRGNHVEITDYGWLHEQDNKKIIREDGEEDVLLVQEKGYNVYKKVPDEKCLAAKNWWTENQEFWAKARNQWDDIFNKNEDLALKKEVDEQPLFMHLFPMDVNTDEEKIEETIQQFIEE